MRAQTRAAIENLIRDLKILARQSLLDDEGALVLVASWTYVGEGEFDAGADPISHVTIGTREQAAILASWLKEELARPVLTAAR